MKFTIAKPTLDWMLVLVGLSLFILCLFIPAIKNAGDKEIFGYEAGNIAISLLFELFSDFEFGIIPIYIDAIANILICFSPLLLLFFKKPKSAIIFSGIFWLFSINAAATTFLYLPKTSHTLIGFYIWVLSFALISLGYLVRYLRLREANLFSPLPLILSFVSITFLIPGVTLPALSMEGIVYKAKAFESSKEIIIDSFINRVRVKAENKGLSLTDSEVEKSKNGIKKTVDSLLSSLGFGKESIKGTIKVYDSERSILTAVGEMYKAGYGFVAFLVVLFSVIVPIIKIGLIISYSVTKKAIFQSIANIISKWSMADVFSIAIIISFFAANSYKFDGLLQMNAKLGVGFYFFIAYCLISIASSQINFDKTKVITEAI
jgi:hypothetical protein